MLDLLKRPRDIILPTPDILRSRGEISTDVVEIEDRHFELLTRFDSLVVDSHEILDKRSDIKDELDRVVGTRYWYDVMTADGVDRGTTAYVPDESIASDYPFSLLIDLPYLTGLEGHNDRIAEIFMKELGITVVLVGPEFSAAEPKLIGAEMKLGKVACLSTATSVSKLGEASAFIYEHLQKEYPHLNLSSNVVGAGESRGAIIEEIRKLYLSLLGLNPLYSDITDPVISEQALTSAKNTLKLLRWPIREGLGALAVGAALFKKGDLHRELDTLPADVRQMIGALVGSGPALLSGEEGEFHNYTALVYPQHIVNFRSNTIADTNLRRNKYKHHSLTDIVELNGCHIGLGYPSVQRHVVDRAHGLGSEMIAADGNVKRVNWNKVHMKDKGDSLHGSLIEKTAS